MTSTGTCNLCGGAFGKAAMTRHLKACQEKQARPAEGGKSQKTFWVTASGEWNPEYWLHLEMPASAKLEDLDAFLRDTWLECCGHLSAFTINDIEYEMDTGGVDAMWPDFFGRRQPPKSMAARLYSVLKPGMKFDHVYDFGTSTELKLKVIAEQARSGQSREISVLARNDPPDIRCAKCDKPATLVCSQCIYEGPQAWLCDRHAERHKCGEDMCLPVVNSPRVGMCGYSGDADYSSDVLT